MNFTRAVAAMLALAVLLTGIGGVAMAAQPTIDTDDTDSAGTSDITAGATVEYNDSTNSTIQWDADSSDTAISIDQVDDDGNVIAEDVYTSTDPEVVNETDGTYAVTLDDDGADYDGVTYDGGEQVHFNATIQNDTTLDEPDELHVEYTWNTSDTQSVSSVTVTAIDDADIGATVDSETIEPRFGFMSSIPGMDSLFQTEDHTSYDIEDTHAINGTETTVTYDLADSDVANAWSEQVDEDAKSGDLVVDQTVLHGTTDAKTVAPVFYGAVDEDRVADGGTYAVYDADADELTIHPGSDTYEGEDEMAVRLTNANPTDISDMEISNEDLSAAYSAADMGFIDRLQSFGEQGLFW